MLVARGQSTGQIVGFACRSIREVFVNGLPEAVGYLGGLHILPEHRNRGIVARGFQQIRQLHADGQAKLYLTTIGADNLTAKAILLSAARLPRY